MKILISLVRPLFFRGWRMVETFYRHPRRGSVRLTKRGILTKATTPLAEKRRTAYRHYFAAALYGSSYSAQVSLDITTALQYWLSSIWSTRRSGDISPIFRSKVARACTMAGQ